MKTATVVPGNDPMHEQNEREDPQRERRFLASRPHAFAQEVRIERREGNDPDDGEDCEIRTQNPGMATVPAIANNAAAAATNKNTFR